jgi:hypothetical protein
MQDLMFYVLVFTACPSLYFLHDIGSFAINKLRRTCLMGTFLKRITVIFLQWNTKTSFHKNKIRLLLLFDYSAQKMEHLCKCWQLFN